MSMTYDLTLAELLHCCESFPNLIGYQICVIRDIHGRLRLVLQPGSSASPIDIIKLAQTLQQRLDGYFVAPILLTNSQIPHERRLAQEIWQQKTAWPPTWPHHTIDPLSQVQNPIDESRYGAFQRVLSKEEWLSSAGSQSPWPLVLQQTPPIVSFYSFKGGVGRSTLLGIFAWHLASEGRKVCILDLDLEAPGVGTLLNARTSRGILDLIVDHVATGQTDLAGSFSRAESLVVHADRVTVFPAGNMNWAYLEKLGRLDFAAQSPLHKSESPVLIALKEILKAIRREHKPDYILIDSRAGLHDLGGLSLHALSHVDVLVARASEQNYLGMELTIQALARRRKPTDTLRCLTVHSFAPLPQDQPRHDFETRAFRERMYTLFLNYVYGGQSVPALDDPISAHFPWLFVEHEALERASQLEASLVPPLTEPSMMAIYSRFKELMIIP